jgi:hypothetical protein
MEFLQPWCHVAEPHLDVLWSSATAAQVCMHKHTQTEAPGLIGWGWRGRTQLRARVDEATSPDAINRALVAALRLHYPVVYGHTMTGQVCGAALGGCDVVEGGLRRALGGGRGAVCPAAVAGTGAGAGAGSG